MRLRKCAPAWVGLFLIAWAAGGPSVSVAAGWEADLALGSAYSTNENATTFEDPGVLHACEGRAAVRPLSVLTLAGAGAFYARSDVGDHDTLQYELSAILARSARDGSLDGRGSLSVGEVSNGSALEIFDRREVAGELSLKWRPLRTASVLTRAGAQATDWVNLWGLDSREFWASSRMHASLPTRTSVILSLGVEHREYTEALSGVQSSLPTLPLAQQRRKGPGRENGEPGGDQVFESSSTSAVGGGSGSSSTLGLVRLRLAQNLASGVGASLEGVWRGAADYLARYYEADDLPILGGVPQIDDRFGYRLRGGGAGLHWRLSAAHRIDVTGEIESRDYVGRGALDLDGNTLGEDRADSRWEVGLDYEFALGGRPLVWKVSCSHLCNDSNDPLYDYRRTVALVSALIRLH